MKNRLLFFSFVFLSLFLCCGNVSAKTKVGINIDANEHFNYYYEQKSGTAFYNLVRDFSNRYHVYDYFGVNENQAKEYNLYSFYSSDLQSAEMKKYSREHSDPWLEDVSIPDNSYYALVFVYSSYNGSFPAPITSIDGNNYSVNYQSYEKNNNNYANGGKYSSIIRFYDEQGNYISNSEVSNFYFNYTTTYSFDDYDDESSADFTYMLSSCISCYYKLGIGTQKIVITDIIEDNTHYLIDDNDNYSGWLRKLFSFGKLDYVSVVNTDLNYFKTNIIKGNLPTISNIVNEGINLNIPDNFTSFVLNDDTPSGILIPKDINNTELDRNIYTVAVDVLDRHLDLNDGNKSNDIINPQITIDLYDYNDSFKRPHSKAQFTIYTPKIYYAQKLDFVSLFSDNNLEDKDITDFSYSFGLYGKSVKMSAAIYYDSNSYALCVYNETNNNGCTYYNPKTNSEVNLTKAEIYNILKKSTLPGQFYEDTCASRPDYDSSYNYDMNCNKTTLKDPTGSDGILSGLDDITSFLSSFKSVISSIFSFVILLLDSLPSEIKSVLLFGLIGGTIITLYKIIRG